MTLKKNVLGERGTLAFAVLFLAYSCEAPLSAYEPHDGEQEAAGPADPQAGTFLYRGGQAIGKIARTTTGGILFGETGGWITLPGSLTWTVPAGTTQLFNVSYSAECRLVNGGVDDFVRIRIVDTGGVGTPLEPYNGGQAFCHADGYATHKASWVKRARPGVHTLVVQVWIYDGAPAEVLTGDLDDIIFELVVYS